MVAKIVRIGPLDGNRTGDPATLMQCPVNSDTKAVDGRLAMLFIL